MIFWNSTWQYLNFHTTSAIYDTYQENSACGICTQSENFAEITSLWDSSEIDWENLILSNDYEVKFNPETPDASIFTFL